MIKTEFKEAFKKVVRTLLKQGQDPAFIARAMELSKKEVRKLGGTPLNNA